MTRRFGSFFGGPASADERRGWRVGHQGRDRMYYEELRDGTWERLDIDGEMLTGRAHHVIYFATAERWLSYPPWARERRDEIIARITSEFREPDYEYYGLSGTASTAGSAGSAPASTASKVAPAGARARKRSQPPAGLRALLVAVLLLFVLAAAMGWLVATGMARGETRLPLRQATLRRTVSRAQEPATFWLSIGMYAAVGAGSLALGALGAKAARRL